MDDAKHYAAGIHRGPYQDFGKGVARILWAPPARLFSRVGVIGGGARMTQGGGLRPRIYGDALERKTLAGRGV